MIQTIYDIVKSHGGTIEVINIRYRSGVHDHNSKHTNRIMRITFIIFLFFPLAIYCQSMQQSETDPIDELKVRFFQAENDTTRASLLWLILANSSASNPDSSLYYGAKALELARTLDKKELAVFAMGFMGNAYHNKGNLPKALEITLASIAEAEGLSLSEEINIGPSYSTLGDIYTTIGDYPRAFTYYSKILEIRGSEDDGSTAGFAHFGRATVYAQMGELDSTMIELNASYKNFIGSKFRDYQVIPNWFNLRAKVYAQQGKIDLALKDYFVALSMTVKSNDSYYTANSYNDIAGLYATIHAVDSAIYYALNGLEEARKISYASGMLAASEILASQFDGKDDSKALRYLKLADSTRGQLYGAGNIQVMKDMISQNERRQQEAANAEAAYQSKLRINGLLGIALALVITTVFLIRNNRNKKRANHIIQQAYEDLKNTQSQLIQSEKMASLGELTAGIAHEIQNPLNFVNNFSEVNKELIDEMKLEIKKGNLAGVDLIADDVRVNEEKISHHGKRADAIVKGMLQHSRSSGGVKEPTDINALADEYLRLAYHGLRAKDKNFKVTLNTDFDPTLAKINVVPQDIGRVMLNLITNAFYAVSEEHKQQPVNYLPTVILNTRKSGDSILISVKDNGNGIPDSIKEKIFQPFFTTKPTGQGTGLGLSLSYDIVKAHGGELTVETIEGQGSEFIIRLPVI